ncbi:MAG: PilN domain-containing protein [Candidatus Aureabacteria bacterium]|nr:PilN domain-containing protein [Candidatus Auribacterota bacterium]
MEKSLTICNDLKDYFTSNNRYFAYIRKTSVQIYLISSKNEPCTVTEIIDHSFESSTDKELKQKLEKASISSLDIVLPRDFFVNKRIALPAADFKEARKMALLKLPKLSPFPPEDSIAKVSYAGKDNKGYINIHLWIINRKILYNNLYIFGKSEVLVNNIRLDLDGIPKLWERSRIKGTPYMSILKDKTSVHFSILKNDCILNSRTVIFPSTDLEKNVDSSGFIFSEMQRFIAFNKEEFPEDLPEECFCFLDQISFPEEINELSGIRIRKISYKEAGFIAAKTPCDIPFHAMISVLKNDSMNFLPSGYKTIINKIRRSKKIIKAGLFVCAFFITFITVFTITYGRKKQSVESLKKELSKIEHEARSIKKLYRRILSAQNIKKQQLIILNSLAEIIPQMNRNMRISSFSMVKNNIIDISGHAKSNTDVYDFMKKIRKRNIFEKVEAEGSIDRKKVKGTEVSTFRLKIYYKDPANNRENL